MGRKNKSVKKLGGDWQTCGFVVLIIAGTAGTVGLVVAWKIVEAVA